MNKFHFQDLSALCAAITLVIVSVCGEIAARQTYAAVNGSDGNSGTSATAAWTINKAVNQALAGDTVNVMAGTYNITIRNNICSHCFDICRAARGPFPVRHYNDGGSQGPVPW